MNHTISMLLAGAASLLSISIQAATETCQPAREDDIAALFVRWNEDLQSGVPKQVVNNYAANSLLLPTQSNTPRRSAAAKEDYFSHFMTKRPTGTIDSRMVQIGCTTALDTGLYTFHFADGSAVQARYTFTYKWYPQEQRWLITSHHSSTMPEETANTR
ncbi:SgcJ/EcaC family oxidoreductase [Stutzerimonas stutzeri]|uniref:SgcJ/EcaC family oxidoreductase n=1 Tax=Stutzerimonas sp. S1 TaxID=3030652 RepID=UPI0022253946|nr:SgcJ/EcaC family oxidoreductase [Stutzerimonas sp. S1]MCW3149891.1 SgcJ/EcaC family oxidoreductase [Stutzerimonas sp. S1]